MPITVLIEIYNAVVGCNNKDRPTVYQKRSQLLIRKDAYNW